MTNHTPKISVVMSAYNRPQYAKEAIESILNQTYRDFEFIIIDDCSTDNTADVIQSYADKDDRIVFIRNPKNMDYNYNLRRGFEMAKGEYIARMDDDDISMPERFEKQVKFLDEHKDVTVLGTFIETFGSPDVNSWVTLSDSDELAIAMNFYNPLCHPSVMIRNSFLKEHNLNYSPTELYAEEYWLWKEIILKGGKLANLSEELLHYRVHPESVTKSRDTGKIQNETAERVRESLLNRFYNNKDKVKEIRKKIAKYPFELNNKKYLENILDRMKQFSDIVSIDGIERFKEKFLGRPCTMDIFFASDDKFTQHLCTAMASILINSLSFDNFNFYIMDGGIKDTSKRNIEKLKEIKNFNVEFIKIDDSLFNDCPITADCQHISKQTYYRYIIPKLKPELDKAFYLDCDIIVKNSLNTFWNMDLEDNYVAAVEELYRGAEDDEKRLNITTELNAGVILINLKKWKQDNILEKLFQNTKYLIQKNILKWQDQDVFNYTFNNKIKFISPRYNLQCNAYYEGRCTRSTAAELRQAKAFPVIIHYNSHKKPWNKKCKHPLWREYFNYLKYTSYKKPYYQYVAKNSLKNVKSIFYSKKKVNKKKTRIKILGITVFKKIKSEDMTEKYLFGIKISEKKD